MSFLSLNETIFISLGNFYGTPKPPAEPNLVQPDLVDQVLFEEDYGSEVQRKRTTSVSKMDRKDSVVPEEEEDEERPQLPNGIPGQFTDFNVCVLVLTTICMAAEIDFGLKLVIHTDTECASFFMSKLTT